MKHHLLEDIGRVERIASTSRLGRLLHNPLKYLYAILYRKFIYSRTKKPKHLQTTLFWGREMWIALPAATDIFITGGKSHNSETRLARLMIREVHAGMHFLDVGAHFGYYTLLASDLVGGHGKVYAFEPSDESFGLLQQNAAREENVKLFKNALSDKEEKISFHEFQNLYSEYNSIHINQFEGQAWFNPALVKKKELNALTIDGIVSQDFHPGFIKIDVEGAEYKVLCGGLNFLKAASPLIAMEYLEEKRSNREHVRATALLREMGYHSNIIKANGELQVIDDIDGYFADNHLDSDNIVFRKSL